jgi:hypothetical protein
VGSGDEGTSISMLLKTTGDLGALKLMVEKEKNAKIKIYQKKKKNGQFVENKLRKKK